MKDIPSIIMLFCKEIRIRLPQSANCIIQSDGFQDWHAGLLLGAVLLSLSITPVARAQSGSEDASLFSTFGQLNAGVTVMNGILIGTNACVPTATVNGLGFLEDYQLSIGQPDPLSFSPTYTSVNNLATAMQTFNNNIYRYYNAATNFIYWSYVPNDPNAPPSWAFYTTQANVGGTYTTSMFNGLQTYLSLAGNNPAPTISISGQVAAGTPGGWISGAFNPGMNVAMNTTPTAGFLADALNANFAVELTLEWGVFNTNGAWLSYGGGHEITLESINMTNTTGTMQFLDPWGNSAVQTLGTLLLTNGYLFVTDSATNDPFDYLEATNYFLDDFDGTNDVVALPPGDLGGLVGRIDVDMIESVPEPSTYSLAAGGAAFLITFGVKFYRKRRST
jgi:hypothetical protein